MNLPPILSSLLQPNDKTFIQFLRYGVVATAAMVFDFGTYTALVILAHTNPVIANTAGFCIGIAVMYALSIRWVFSSRQRKRHAEIIGFFTIGLIGLALTNIIVWLIAVAWDQNDLLAKAAAVVIVFFWNFGARKWLLFKNMETP